MNIIYLIIAGVVLSFTGVIIYKLKKGKRATTQNIILKRQKNSTIKIQRERQRIEKEKEEIKTAINNADSNDLANQYDEQLQNLPEPKRSRD